MVHLLQRHVWLCGRRYFCVPPTLCSLPTGLEHIGRILWTSCKTLSSALTYSWCGCINVSFYTTGHLRQRFSACMHGFVRSTDLKCMQARCKKWLSRHEQARTNRALFALSICTRACVHQASTHLESKCPCLHPIANTQPWLRGLIAVATCKCWQGTSRFLLKAAGGDELGIAGISICRHGCGLFELVPSLCWFERETKSKPPWGSPQKKKNKTQHPHINSHPEQFRAQVLLVEVCLFSDQTRSARVPESPACLLAVRIETKLLHILSNQKQLHNFSLSLSPSGCMQRSPSVCRMGMDWYLVMDPQPKSTRP